MVSSDVITQAVCEHKRTVDDSIGLASYNMDSHNCQRVVQHGVVRNEGDVQAPPAAEQDYIELHPLGRVENGYRWAGETDIFEAIEAVCRQYSIDRDRIVLRGMSMGASGTWHLGLKHPARFVAPEMVVVVEHRGWSSERLLWHPVYKGLRIDKAATDVGPPDMTP